MAIATIHDQTTNYYIRNLGKLIKLKHTNPAPREETANPHCSKQLRIEPGRTGEEPGKAGGSQQ